jgi:hypothetical protein
LWQDCQMVLTRLFSTFGMVQDVVLHPSKVCVDILLLLSALLCLTIQDAYFMLPHHSRRPL